MRCSRCQLEHGPDRACNGVPTPATQLFAGTDTPAPTNGDGLVGTQIGAFTLVRKLGEGGMGSVFLGEHAVIGSKVAVKMLHPHLATSREVVNRFFAEARAVNLIGHENIVSIFDLNAVPPDKYYLVMEYLEGQPLSNLCAEPMEPALAVKILSQACDALEAAHAAGVVHRDLKPENIFVLKRGRNPHFVKVLDFGIAKLFHSNPSERTSLGAVIGTPEFMSPEQAVGEAIDGRSDVYALGVIAYRLLTGELPFTGRGLAAILLAHASKPPRPLEQLRPELPKALCAAVLRALAKDPAERFQKAGDFAEALEAAVKPGPTPLPILPAPRHQAGFKGQLERTGRPPLEVRCQDISKGGVFLAELAELPPLFSRGKLTLSTGEGTLSSEVEIVRHVTPEQARTWGMSPGAGVQFVNPSGSFRDKVGRLIAGLPMIPTPAPPPGGDPEADQVLERFRERPDDPYLLLGARADSDFGDLRALVRDARSALETLTQKHLSPTQKATRERLLGRIAQAEATLCDPIARARYDAVRGNFYGIARCIAAGLDLDRLATLQKEYREKHPEASERAEIHLITGEALAAQGDMRRAITEFEAGLAVDPLAFSLHQRYWKARRRV